MGIFKFEPLKKVKRGIIVDTDIGPDCDDVGALVVLHKLAERYDIPVLGIINCTSNPYGTGAIDVINNFCGNKNTPIGMYSKPDFLCNDDAKAYNKYISERFATEYEPVGSKAPEDAVRLYRRLLAQAEDNSVILVTIGPLNTVAQLLTSDPDDICNLNGTDLVAKKVYAAVSMAGATENKQREYNIVCDAMAACTFIDLMSVPVIYSGFELGYSIDSGFSPEELPENWENNPVVLSYKLYTEFRQMKPYINKSYDLTAVHFAFEGEGDFYKLSGSGKVVLDKNMDDATEFVPCEDGNSYYIELNCPSEAIGREFSLFLRNAGKKDVKILNFGSLNIDHVYQVNDFVRAGQTIAATDYALHVGGKGLNQSVALAKAGANVYHGGKIGCDGQMLKKFLQDNDVNVSYVMTDDVVATGHAIIQVAPNGENCIIIFGGSNATICEKEIDFVLDDFSQGDYLLLQNEISNIDYIIEKAHEKGMVIILNPSPITDSLAKSKYLSLLDWVILNRGEAEAFAPDKETLKNVFPKANIIQTLGTKGAVAYIGKEEIFVPAVFLGPAVDTTGAGDTYTGYFFAGILNGDSIEQSLKTAAVAAAISVTKEGAARSIPSRVNVKL